MAKYVCSNCGKQLQKIYPLCPYCKKMGSVQKDIAKGRSTLLLVSSILGVLYAIYIVSYFFRRSIKCQRGRRGNWRGTCDDAGYAAYALRCFSSRFQCFRMVYEQPRICIGWRNPLCGGSGHVPAIRPVCAHSDDSFLCWVREIKGVARVGRNKNPRPGAGTPERGTRAA